MKYSTRIVLALALGAVFIASGYSAEEKPKPAKVLTDGEVDEAWRRRVPEIDLGDHLPLAEVARFLGERFPEVNFIVPQNALNETVPHLRLRSVALTEILKAIEIASDGRIRGGVPGEPQNVDATGLPVRTAVDIAKGNLVTFNVGPLPGTAPILSPAVCRVFSLAPYLSSLSEKEAQMATKELYDALLVAWDMLMQQDRDVRQPTLKIHDGTKLLIAVGREKELAVIDQVVSQLQGAAPLKRVTTPAENDPRSKTRTVEVPPAARTKP